jgi:acetate kinase
MAVIVVNVGSATVKLSLVSGDERLDNVTLAISGDSIDERRLSQAIAALGPCDVVGHRLVHGGSLFRSPVVIDDEVRHRLAEVVDLAPLHLPRALACVDLVRGLLPDVPNVACFDTAFHATLPEASATYAVPGEWRRRWGLRRYGFHGLSHAWASRRAAELLGRPFDGLRVVTCHLGAGASLAAVHSGVSVDTTMGFTPLEGLVMATRAGTVDPGLVLWLLQSARVEVSELAESLEHRSGLLALAGTSDVPAILDAEAAGDEGARLALSVYLRSLRAAVASMAAAMDGLDALVFTGGVGEHAAPIRARAADGLGFLGVAVDRARNAAPTLDAEVSADGAACRTLVVAAREDVQIAREITGLFDGEARRGEGT